MMFFSINYIVRNSDSSANDFAFDSYAADKVKFARLQIRQ
jgi:hypothetical protein